MGFHVKLPKIRIVPSRDERMRSIVQGADHAEALTNRAADYVRPYTEKLHAVRTRLATLAVALLAIWLALHVTFGANGMVVYRTKRTQYQQLQKEIDSLQKENDSYSQQVDQLKTDPRRIEKEAREQFHYARPGEVVYVAPETPPPPPPANHTASK
jgi:cell division protein FtsB